MANGMANGKWQMAENKRMEGFGKDCGGRAGA